MMVAVVERSRVVGREMCENGVGCMSLMGVRSVKGCTVGGLVDVGPTRERE